MGVVAAAGGTGAGLLGLTSCSFVIKMKLSGSGHCCYFWSQRVLKRRVFIGRKNNIQDSYNCADPAPPTLRPQGGNQKPKIKCSHGLLLPV